MVLLSVLERASVTGCLWSSMHTALCLAKPRGVQAWHVAERPDNAAADFHLRRQEVRLAVGLDSTLGFNSLRQKTEHKAVGHRQTSGGPFCNTVTAD